MQLQKSRYSSYAAWLLLPAVLGGLYFGARMIAQGRLSAKLQSASELEVSERAGLWNYNFLSAREQCLYDILTSAMEERDKTTARVTFVPTQAEFSAAFDAVLCDHPQFCDLIAEECTLVAGDKSAYMTLSYLEDGEDRRQALNASVSALAQMAETMTDAEFACYLNDSIAQSCVYHTDASAHATAYDAACSGKADSYGYALLYTLVCREAGIDCAVVRGSVQAGDITGEHAWNVLELDGVTGYTDVMWNDPEQQEAPNLPFHGYYFLSAEEIGADHIPMEGLSFPNDGAAENYYEQMGVCIADTDGMRELLSALLTDARADCAAAVEFWLDPTLGMTDYALEEALTAAIEAANAAEMTGAYLRPVHRLYRSSVNGGGITVQLFYEEHDE